MHIKALMIPVEQLEVVPLNCTVEEALAHIERVDLFSLPVVDEDGHFIGIISKRYLYEAFYKIPNFDRDSFNASPVKDYMKSTLPVVEDNIRIEEAALMMFENRLRFLPIVDPNTKKLIGIIPKNTLLKQYKNIFGIEYPRIVLLVNDFKGKMAEISSIISKNKGDIKNMVKIVTDIPTLSEVILRIDCPDIHKIEKQLEHHGYEVREVTE